MEIGFANNRIFMKKKWGAIGRGYGSRSAVLEAIGLLLPFLQMPKELIGKHILLEVASYFTCHGTSAGALLFQDICRIPGSTWLPGEVHQLQEMAYGRVAI
jgi:hypothetical protein